ncbi:low-density lipoprotein receptor-related protein 12-like [Diadema setosum]|uniref:low-density lipoprotein receptor-related protein 12-like n=1 Tax=Diadema setosum TaxID=31175 RepID=UPI003B3B06CD
MGHSVLTQLLVTLLFVSGTFSTNQNVETAYIQDRVRSLLCMPKNVSDTAGRVASHHEVEHEPYADSMDCTFTMNAKPGQFINIRFDFFDLAASYDIREKRCRMEGDYLSIYESGNIFLIKGNILEPAVKLCGGTGKFPSDYQSVSNVVTVRFYTDDYHSPDNGIKFTYTAFYNPAERTPDCFMCTDGTMCIDKDLTCNGMPNCNDDSDEEASLCQESSNIFQKGVETLGIGVMVAIGAGSGLILLCLLILCIVCCCCCTKRNNPPDQKAQYRAPPTPRPGSYPSHNSNYSSYSSSASNTAGRPYPNFPPGYPPFHNGGYSVGYNYENGRMEFPQKV